MLTILLGSKNKIIIFGLFIFMLFMEGKLIGLCFILDKLGVFLNSYLWLISISQCYSKKHKGLDMSVSVWVCLLKNKQESCKNVQP